MGYEIRITFPTETSTSDKSDILGNELDFSTFNTVTENDMHKIVTLFKAKSCQFNPHLEKTF